MIKNLYFKCKKCGNIETKYMDDKYIANMIYVCSKCGNKEYELTDSDNNFSDIKVKTRLVDNRKLNKEKYMSSEYKAKREQINRFYNERKSSPKKI